MNKTMVGNIVVLLILCAITYGLYYSNSRKICGNVTNINENNYTVTINDAGIVYENIKIDKLTLSTLKSNMINKPHTEYTICKPIDNGHPIYIIINICFFIFTIIYAIRVLWGDENENT